ncbi:MAG: hypothetical protein ACM3U1_09785 [Chloroflexota bacterium]
MPPNLCSPPMPKWLLDAAKADLIISALWLAVAFTLIYEGWTQNSDSWVRKGLFCLLCSYPVLFPASCLAARVFYPRRGDLVKIFAIGPLAVSIVTVIVLILVGK